MRNLEIKLTGAQALGDVAVFVDDKPAKCKKNTFGNTVCRFGTESDTVRLKVCRYIDVGGIVWFFTQLFFFLITVFGIFDVHRKERCIGIVFETDIDMTGDGAVTLQLNPPREGEQAVCVQSDLPRKEASNGYYTDERARKTLRRLKWAKIFLALACVAAAIGVLIVKF